MMDASRFLATCSVSLECWPSWLDGQKLYLTGSSAIANLSQLVDQQRCDCERRETRGAYHHATF